MEPKFREIDGESTVPPRIDLRFEIDEDTDEDDDATTDDEDEDDADLVAAPDDYDSDEF